MDIKTFLSLILLLPVICCDSDHQKNHDDPNWMQYLPSHVVPIVKSRLTTITVANEENTSSNLESDSTGSIDLDENRNASNTSVVMHGTSYNYNSSSDSGVRVGVPVGGIILFFLILFCCIRCCRRKGTQGIVLQSNPPPPQPCMPPNVVVQHIHATPHTLPAQPPSMQHVQQQPQYQHAPPPQQQFVQQTPYPTGYETQQMIQQEWSPHAPMNQTYPQNPAMGNPTAPPPYGKY